MPTAYLNDDQASAKSFRDGWFYPGDLGRWTEDGLLCHMGRADDMMILNGINIYPAEIEQAMLSHPAVADAVALPLKHRVANDVPVCAVVLKDHERVSEQDLLEYARGKLGSHRPKRVAILDAIPRNEHGKVQRAALAQAVAARLGLGRPQRPPSVERASNPEPGVPGQLSLFATVSFRVPPHPDFEQLDAWLSGVLGISMCRTAAPAGGRGCPTTRPGAPGARVAAARPAAVAAAAAGGAHSGVRRTADHRLQAGAGRGDTWRARVSFARVEEMPNAAYDIAFKEALHLSAWALAHPVDAGNLQAFYAMAEQRVTSRLRPMLTSGKSTLPVLRAAHRKSIPFTHLGGGVFQLGWGSKAQRMDRSVTGRDSAIGARLCTDKALTAILLRKAGLPAPVHKVVANLQAALKAAHQIGWPVVVKPVDRERGEGVVVDVGDDDQLRAAFESASHPVPHQGGDRRAAGRRRLPSPVHGPRQAAVRRQAAADVGRVRRRGRHRPPGRSGAGQATSPAALGPLGHPAPGRPRARGDRAGRLHRDVGPAQGRAGAPAPDRVDRVRAAWTRRSRSSIHPENLASPWPPASCSGSGSRASTSSAPTSPGRGTRTGPSSTR